MFAFLFTKQMFGFTIRKERKKNEDRAMDVCEEEEKEFRDRMDEKTCHYMAIDLKSFYASCECRERG